MKNSRLSLLLSLILAAGLSGVTYALDLKVWALPITDQSYDPIDKASVRVDALVSSAHSPADAWLERVRAKNRTLAYDFNVRPVITLQITLLDGEEEADSSQPFIEEARKWAARYGANVVYLDKQLAEDHCFAGMRFKGYRVEYKQRLVSPPFLAALPYVTVPGSILEEQLQAWDVTHFGKVHVSFGSEDDVKASKKAIGILARVKNGTSVHVFMKDGSDLTGAYSGLDDENRIWIHTQGWAGFFRDHAVSTHDIQAVALLN